MHRLAERQGERQEEQKHRAQRTAAGVSIVSGHPAQEQIPQHSAAQRSAASTEHSKHSKHSKRSTMANEVKRKRSIGDSLRTRCASAMHSLRQMSSAVLLHHDEDRDVDNLFETLDSEDEFKDYTDVLRKTSDNTTSPTTMSPSAEASRVRNSKSTTDSTRTSTASTKSTTLSSDGSVKQAAGPAMSGAQLWEEQRAQWLKPTVPKVEYQKRKQTHSLGKLAEYNDDVYLSVYRNLVVYGKPLKRGLNMEDGFRVVYTGWESTRMFERVAKGGAP